MFTLFSKSLHTRGCLQDCLNKHILFIPGVLCTADIWHNQALHFRRRGAEIFYANTHDGHSIEDIARQNLNRLPDHNFVMVAHSMGCSVALKMAEIAPERVSGLILVNGTILPPSSSEKERKVKTIQKIRKYSNMHFEGFLTHRFFADQTSAALTNSQFLLLKRMAINIGPVNFVKQLELTLQRGDQSLIFQHLQNKKSITIIYSRKDNIIVNPEWNKLIHQQSTKLIQDHKSGHLSLLENPFLVDNAISDTIDAIYGTNLILSNHPSSK